MKEAAQIIGDTLQMDDSKSETEISSPRKTENVVESEAENGSISRYRKFGSCSRQCLWSRFSSTVIERC